MGQSMLGVKVRPSRTDGTDDPGHLAVFWSVGPEDSDKVFRGYAFRITDLPEQYQQRSPWREYLFENAVPGYVKDDRGMLDDYLRRKSVLACRVWTVDDEQRSAMATLAEVRRFGWNSFNPDSQPARAVDSTGEPEPCHNCVTWGVAVVNSVVGQGSLPRPPQGRVKLILAALNEDAAHSA